MANKILTYTIEVDGKEVTKELNTISNYQERISQLEKQINDTPMNTKKYKELTKELKQTKGQFEAAKMKSQGFVESLSGAPGVMGQVGKGIQGMSVAFKALMANPVGLFITAIVGALTLLFKAFTSTKEGGEKLKQVTAGLGAAMDVLRDVAVVVSEKLIDMFNNPKQALMDFWQLLKENIINRFEGLLELIPNLGKAMSELFKGNFKNAGKIATDAMGKVVLGVENVTDKVVQAGQAIRETFNEALAEGKEAARLTDVLQGLDDAQRRLNERRAEQNKLIAEAKLKINDETLSYEERIKALEDASAAEQQLLNDELALERQRLSAMEALAAQSDSDAATLDALSQQRIKLSNLELASFQKSKEVFDQTKALRDRQKAEEEARIKEQEALEAEALQKKKDNLDAEIETIQLRDEKEIELLKQKLQQRLELELENEELSNEQRALLKEQLRQKFKEIDEAALEDQQAVADEELRIQQLKEQALVNGLGILSDVLGKETAAGRAAAIAQALVNTYLGASQALSDKSLPTIAKFVAVAGVIATGLKQVQAIKNAGKQGSGDKGRTGARFNTGGVVGGQGDTDTVPALLTSGEAVINKRSTAAFLPLLSSINQAGGGKSFVGSNFIQSNGTANSGGTPIVKAYVVASDVTNEQNLERKIKTRSAL